MDSKNPANFCALDPSEVILNGPLRLGSGKESTPV